MSQYLGTGPVIKKMRERGLICNYCQHKIVGKPFIKKPSSHKARYYHMECAKEAGLL